MFYHIEYAVKNNFYIICLQMKPMNDSEQFLNSLIEIGADDETFALIAYAAKMARDMHIKKFSVITNTGRSCIMCEKEIHSIRLFVEHGDSSAYAYLCATSVTR